MPVNENTLPIPDNTNKRVIYIEPNDFEGRINNIPVTPDYTDYCIYFDMIVNVTSRRDRSDTHIEVGDENSKYIFSWITKPNEDKPSWVSLMRGEDANEYENERKRTYLTTYYTDIHLNEIRQRNLHEGLGVESVNISYESFYTPTVKIRFIDVRGASLFGREEVLHKDDQLIDVEEGLEEDSLWGCFFTYPYPNYRLMFKGFYGKEVTLQLTMTDWRANYNPSTGNFEIDATFLGYDYGVIADIPMAYLIAAPNCRPKGRQYWEVHKTTPYWQLSTISGTMNPPTFMEIARNIRKAIDFVAEEQATASSSNGGGGTSLEDARNAEKNNDISKLKKAFDDYAKDWVQQHKYTYIVNKVGDYPENDKDSLYVHVGTLYEKKSTNPDCLFPTSVDWKKYSEKELQRQYPDIKSDFFKAVKADKSVIDNDFPAVTDVYAKAKNALRDYTKKYPGSKVADLANIVKDKPSKEEMFMSYDVINEEYNNVTSTTTTITTADTTTNDTASTTASTPMPSPQSIESMVGFYPTIGDLFKLVYCHLETFMYLMYDCADIIYGQMDNNDRTPKKLGLKGINETDILVSGTESNGGKTINIQPFPKVVKMEKDKSKQTTETDNDLVETLEWMGNLKGNKIDWAEVSLVNSMVKSLEQWLDSEKSTSMENSEPYEYTILPCDLNDMSISPVALKLNNGIGSLAGYLGYRAAAIFGVSEYAEKYAENIGKLEALAFFNGCQSKNELDNLFFKQIGNENAADTLYNMALCNVEVTPRYDFELGENFKPFLNDSRQKRQPVFKENGEKLQFTHVGTSNGVSLIESYISTWKGLQNDFTYEGDTNGSYYKLEKISNSNFLYKVPSTEIVKMINDGEITNNNYINKEMFNVCYGDIYSDGSEYYEKFVKVYDKLEKGEFALHGYKGNIDLSEMIKSKWTKQQEGLFDNEYIAYIERSYKELGVTDNMLYNEEGRISVANYTPNLDKKANEKPLKYDYNKRAYDTNDIFVHMPSIDICTQNNGSGYAENVFGTKMYYCQNEGDGENRDRRKAFVFLLSVMMGYTDKSSEVIKKILTNKDSYIEGIPCGMALFIGALFYREQYIKNNRKEFLQMDSLYKPLGFYDIPWINNKLYGFILATSTYNYKKLTDLIGNGVIDDNVKNMFIDRFLYFVDHDWKTIQQSCELTEVGGNLMSGKDIESKWDICDPDGEFCKEGNMYSVNDVFDNFKGNYSYIAETLDNGTKGFILLLSETNPAQDVLKSVFMDYVVVANTGANLSTSNKTVAINKSAFMSYLNGFVNQLQDIKGSEEVSTDTQDANDENERDVDLKLEVYNNLRHIWERWLVNNTLGREFFTVKSFMEKSLFIDSLYRNVYKNIHINCEILLNALDNTKSGKMVWQFLSDITTKHHCLFFAYPDYMGIGSDDTKTMYDAMQNIFQPKPFSKMTNDFDQMNKFVVVYTYQTSELLDNKNGYKKDGFDIYSNDPNRVMDTFKRDLIGSDVKREDGESDDEYKNREMMTRYGYCIPSFGVAVGRQNNHIFKNVNIGMTNPVMTEQVIGAMSAIAEKGKGTAGHSVVFHGQDLWNIFSGYSYTCKVDMMGNAQIMPLMYFQLLNMPMFRGAYMIYKVTHSIRPGDMTTSFEATKMSRYTMPWLTEWFTEVYFDKNGNRISKEEYYGMCDTENNVSDVPITVNVDLNKDVEFKVVRQKLTKDYSQGEFYVNGEKLCDTLEAYDPGIYNDNVTSAEVKKLKEKQKIQTESKTKYIAVARGRYKVVHHFRNGPGPKRTYYCGLLTGTVGRAGILIHNGSDTSYTQGCILLGKKTGEGKQTNTYEYMNQVAEIIRQVYNNNHKCYITVTTV